MFFVCPGCGAYANDRPVVGEPPAVTCACGHRHPLVLLPLFVVTGASCTGKTTTLLELAGSFTEVVCLDGDVLWLEQFADGTIPVEESRGQWLRLAANIHQSGRPVLLFASVGPGQYEARPEARYVAGVHTLALVCDDRELERRLRSRPEWRGSGDDAVVTDMLAFNRWLRTAGGRSEQYAPHATVDTTDEDPARTAGRIRDWVGARMAASRPDVGSARARV